jgi:hypothetical protein
LVGFNKAVTFIRKSTAHLRITGIFITACLLTGLVLSTSSQISAALFQSSPPPTSAIAVPENPASENPFPEAAPSSAASQQQVVPPASGAATPALEMPVTPKAPGATNAAKENSSSAASSKKSKATPQPAEQSAEKQNGDSPQEFIVDYTKLVDFVVWLGGYFWFFLGIIFIIAAILGILYMQIRGSHQLRK